MLLTGKLTTAVLVQIRRRGNSLACFHNARALWPGQAARRRVAPSLPLGSSARTICRLAVLVLLDLSGSEAIEWAQILASRANVGFRPETSASDEYIVMSASDSSDLCDAHRKRGL